MNSLILSWRLGQLRTPSAILLRSYHGGKAHSVNSAIEKGLRKSKGIGFRGPRAPSRFSDLRDAYRERNGIPQYTPPTEGDAKPQVSKRAKGKGNDGSPWLSRGKTGRPKRNFTNGRSSGESAFTTRRGRIEDGGAAHPRAFEREKPSRESYVKERNFEKIATSSRFGDLSESNSFDREGSSRQRDTRERTFGQPPRFGAQSNSHPYNREGSGNQEGSREVAFDHFTRPSGSQADSRPFNSSSKLDFQPRSPAFSSKERYPPLSFGARSSGTRPSKWNSSNGSSTEQGSKGSYNSTPEQFNYEYTSHRRASADGTSIFKDGGSFECPSRSFESRSPAQSRKWKDRYPNLKSIPDTGPDKRGIKLDGAIQAVDKFYGKRHEGSATSTPRITHIVSHNIPLSIPYTTPASEFLYGTSVVEAALTSRIIPRRKLYKLYIYGGENREDPERDSRLEQLARKKHVDVKRVGNDWVRLMDKMSSGRPHNGYVLEASPLPRLPVTHLGEFKSDDDQAGFDVSLDYQSREDAAINGTSDFVKTWKSHSGRKPLVLLLDSIVDPGNLGGIIRTASFLGVSAVAISTRNSASFTPIVLKASAGASENVTLFSVRKPSGFVIDSKAAGWKVYAAVAPSKRNDPSMPASISTDELDDPLSESPCILMLGSEGEGLRWNLRSKADIDLYIEGSSQSYNVDSLNVSVATGILCKSFLRKKDLRKLAAAPLVNESIEAETPPPASTRELF